MLGFKRVLVVAAVALIGAGFAPASASAQTPHDKLERGLVNVVTGVLELPVTIRDEARDTNPVQALTVGLVKGAWRSGKRMAIGVYEIATFPLKGTSNFGPLIEPERVWDRY